MPPRALVDAFRFYLDHQDEIVAEHNGKVVAIADGEVLGAYGDEMTAVTETEKRRPVGTFIVQKVSPGPDDCTQTFHSRVAFS